MFESLIYSARRELVITTPYYVPDDPMQSALCASAYRGVATTIVFPARNDSWIVGAASRSYYRDHLLTAGVRIFEYVGGLLHTKSLTLDGEVTLIGSANMDRHLRTELRKQHPVLRSVLTADMRQRQQEYIACSRPVALNEVTAWPVPRRRLWNNAIAMLGPVL